jgi:hypothetical protein
VPEHLTRAGDQIQHYVGERPTRSIFGLLLAAILIGIGIWAWPELHRTIHIHRM